MPPIRCQRKRGLYSKKMRKAWHRSPFSKQVLEYLEDEISSSPTPISLTAANVASTYVKTKPNPDFLAHTNKLQYVAIPAHANCTNHLSRSPHHFLPPYAF